MTTPDQKTTGPARPRSILLARWLGAGGGGLGVVVLVGWVIGHHGIKSVLPGAVEMKANTAAGLLLAGVALCLSRRAISGRRRLAIQALALVVLLLGLATLGEYLFGWQLGIDELLFTDHTLLFTSVPGRMSPYSTVAFSALGIGLLLLPIRGWQWVSGAAGAAAAAIGTFSLLGYAWNATELVTDQVIPPVALHTAAGFLLLGGGLLLASNAIRRWLPHATGRATRLDQPVLLAWFGAFLVIVIVGGSAYRVSTRSAAAAAEVNRTQGIQVALGRLYGYLSDAESTQRAYLLTDSPTLRTEYRQLTGRARDELAALHDRFAHDSLRSRQADLLSALALTRLMLLDRHLEVYDSAGLVAAQLALRTSDGMRLMESADSLVRVIDREESQLLRRYQADAAREQRDTLTGLLVMIVVATAGFFLLFVFIRRVALRREAAEQALRASEEHLKVTLHSIGDGVLVTDSRGRVTSLNAVGEELTGWTEAEATGHPVREVFDLRVEGSDAPAYLPVDDVLRLGVTRSLANHSELASRDGMLRAVADSCAPIHDTDGAVVGAVLVFRDVTPEREAAREIERQQQRLAELNASLEERVEARTRELWESEQRFADLFESAPDALVVVSPAGRITLANRRAEQLFGRSRQALAGLAIEELVPAGPRDRVPDRPQRFVRSPDAEWSGEPGRQLVALRADGSEVPVDISLSVTEAPGGRITTVAIRDITDRVRLEQQFHQAQRMETVGQLAGGIAHDFNNLLSVINNVADLASDGLGADDPMRGELAAIHDAGTRAAALTRQLLAFSRKTLTQPEVVDLGAVVAGMQPMLGRLLGEHIAISCRCLDGPTCVRIDPAQLEQVILNLGVNSRDAMPGGGELRIETSVVQLDQSYTRQHAGVTPGDYVLLAVTDTGHGMDATTREHIFEPFFTTKSGGKGTGLGLATVYGIVKQAGGHIWVYSEVGRGTTMKVYLPAVSDAASAPEHDRIGSVTPARGGETILVVEDEAALQRVVRRILEGAGYRVLVAGTAEEALELAHREGQTIDMLLTDVVMPGMSGRELAQEMVALYPQLPVLFTSGYTDDTIMHHGVLEDGVAFISKPYSVQDLTRKVRTVLNG